MALRLKYAGVDTKEMVVEKDVVEAARKAAAASKDTCFILPTYTAMLEVRNAFAPKDDELAQLGKVTKRGI